eukprot:scaffold172918_cov31-Tisochrysis_lutea.AAC.2
MSGSVQDCLCLIGVHNDPLDGRKRFGGDSGKCHEYLSRAWGGRGVRRLPTARRRASRLRRRSECNKCAVLGGARPPWSEGRPSVRLSQHSCLIRRPSTVPICLPLAHTHGEGVDVLVKGVEDGD